MSSRWVDNSPQEKKTCKYKSKMKPIHQKYKAIRVDTTQRKKTKANNQQQSTKGLTTQIWIHLKEDNRKL